VQLVVVVAEELFGKLLLLLQDRLTQLQLVMVETVERVREALVVIQPSVPLLVLVLVEGMAGELALFLVEMVVLAVAEEVVCQAHTVVVVVGQVKVQPLLPHITLQITLGEQAVMEEQEAKQLMAQQQLQEFLVLE
jgi:hypothetical protein